MSDPPYPPRQVTSSSRGAMTVAFSWDGHADSRRVQGGTCQSAARTKGLPSASRYSATARIRPSLLAEFRGSLSYKYREATVIPPRTMPEKCAAVNRSGAGGAWASSGLAIP